jgi:acyl-coenzyme A synthetase/AMP-(fatty) acid ligase
MSPKILSGVAMSSAPESPVDAVLALCKAAGSTPDTVNHTDLMLYRHCREGRGSAIALYFEGQAHSYEELAAVTARCTAWLRLLGIRPGDRVILALPDCAMLASTYFGIVAAGATAVILDPALPNEDAFHIAQLCEARLAIVHDKSAGRLAGVRFFPGMIAVINSGVSWIHPSELVEAIGCQQHADRIIHGAPEGYAYGLLSSGSTGRPKLIVHRHQDILYGYFGFARDVLALNEKDRIISVAKMTTGYGLGCSLLMPFLRGASSTLVAEPPGAAVIASAIEAHCCTLLFAQPRFLADVTSMNQTMDKLRSLRLVVTGGEPLGSALSDRWERHCKAELLDSYGSTEIGFLYISNRPGEKKGGSVGKPVDGLQIEVIDESGDGVQPGQIGRLRARGSMMISGYWNDPERTAQTFQNGWFTTSDMFSVDREGFYFIHGRSDHLIKLGCGDWVNPTQLEMELLNHPDVRECAVVGSPNESGLTVLKAVVVVDAIRPPSRELALELSTTIRERWPGQEYKRIETVEFTEALPKTMAGKLDRGKLRPQSMTEFSYKC